MCGLAGINLCVLVCDWSATEAGRLIERIYTACTSKLGVGQDHATGQFVQTGNAAHAYRRRAWPRTSDLPHPASDCPTPLLCS
jgi:hypothetical protein